MNSWLSKIRSVHTCGVRQIHVFARQCISLYKISWKKIFQKQFTVGYILYPSLENFERAGSSEAVLKKDGYLQSKNMQTPVKFQKLSSTLNHTDSTNEQKILNINQDENCHATSNSFNSSTLKSLINVQCTLI